MARKITSALFVGIWAGFALYMRYVTKNFAMLAFAGGFLFAAALWLGILFFVERHSLQKIEAFIGRVDFLLEKVFREKNFFYQVWALAFVVFLLGYIAWFPGIFGFDAPIQFAMYMGDLDYFTAQQPLLHTLFIGNVICLGKAVLGSYQAGFALLVLIQGLLISNGMAQTAVFLRRRNVSIALILIGQVWLFINPFIQILNCNVTKDVLCGIFIVDFFMALMDMLEKEKNNAWDIVKLILSGILMCQFRNGMVLPVLGILVLCILFRMKKREIYISLAAIAVFTELFSFTADKVFGIEKGPGREYMSIPIQQMAFVMYSLNEGTDVDIDSEEVEEILQLMPDENVLFNQFLPYCADPPKALFQDEVFRSDVLKYLKMYIHVGMKNPVLYKSAWINIVSPFFNMNQNGNLGLMIINTFSYFYDNEVYQIHPAEKYLAFYKARLQTAIVDKVKLLNDPVLPILLLGLLVGRIIYNREKRTFIAVFLILFYFVGMLLAPIALYRYAYPLAAAFPVLLGLLFRKRKRAIV